MKAGTTELLKFKKLRMRLNLRQWETVGVLESLWAITAKNAPQGDIGKLSNEDIAIAIDWAGDADQLIESLLECGWLDADEDFRLIVHDWSEHAPNYLKGNLKKHGRDFADYFAKQRARQSTKQAAWEPAKQTTKQAARHAPSEGAIPSQAKSSQFKPPPPIPSSQVAFAKTEEEEAVELLVSFGVQFAVPAVRTAFANGATLRDIQLLCDVYQSQPGRWDSGALQRRVTNFSRAEAPDQGSWPDPAPKWLRDQDIRQRASERVQQAAEQDEIKARDKTARHEREQRHGPRFNAMSDEQVRSLITEIFAGEFVLAQHQSTIARRGMTHYRESPAYRDQIFQRLEQLEKVA